MSDQKTSVKKTAKSIANDIEKDIKEHDAPDRVRMEVIRHLEANVPASPPQSEVANTIIETARSAAIAANLDPDSVLKEVSHKVTVPAAPEPPPPKEEVLDKKGARK